ncbi:MAG: hypothetical protein QOI24_3882 [Acidobacteriota bacterium]|nr:hypothetical protein [Acidobacteriota bacterium]
MFESASVAESADTTKSRVPWGKIAIVLLAVAGLIVLFRVLPVNLWMKQFQLYVQGLGAAGYVLYVLAYIVCCVFFIPAIALTLGAGAIYGFALGSVIVIIGGTLGATAAFLLARTIFRKKVEAMTAGNAKFRALDRAIAKEGAKIVFLIRLAPIFPFTWVNYAFGLTGISTLRYVVATFFGIIPVTLAFVWASAAATAAATGSASTLKTTINVVGVIVAIAVTTWVARIATQAIKRAGVDA